MPKDSVAAGSPLAVLQRAMRMVFPNFQDRQVWDPRIRAYRLVRVGEAELERLRRVRAENQRRQQQHHSRCPHASRTS